MADLGNAKDIVENELGIKDQYGASEISKIKKSLEKQEKEKVYQKN